MNEPQYIIGDDVFGFAAGQHVAIEIRDGMISLVTRIQPGDADALIAAEPESVLDLRTQLLLPGLVDAHVHAIATGMLMLSTMVSDAASLEEVEAAVRSEAAKDRDFVRLGGLDISRIGASAAARIDRDLLDSWVPERPLFLKSTEGHSSWFNTKAWDYIGVDGYIERTGVAEDSAAEMKRTGRVHGSTYESLTTPIYDSYSAEERREGMDLVLAAARRAGLTGLHCLEGYGDHRREDFELIIGLNGTQGVDLVLYCRDTTPKLALELEVKRFGGCWCLDGAIGAHSAAVSEPYIDRKDYLGELYFTDEELSGWLSAALDLDMQPCVHAIGDRALAQANRVLGELAAKHDLKQLRPRIDHFVVGNAALAAEAAGLGAVSAMQPAFDARWGGENGGYAMRLGPERALDTNPVGSMQRAGLPLAGSSDSYITPMDPLGGIRAAMNHHNAEHRLSFDESVELFTTGSAYLSHMEARKGRIAAGYSADFTIVEGSRELDDARPVATIHEGRLRSCL